MMRPRMCELLADSFVGIKVADLLPKVQALRLISTILEEGHVRRNGRRRAVVLPQV